MLMYLVRKSYGWDDDDTEYTLEKREPSYDDYIPVIVLPIKDNYSLEQMFKDNRG